MTSTISPAIADKAAKPVRVARTRTQTGNLAALFLLYAITTGLHCMRGFWYDELFTFHMSQMQGMSGVWAGLMGGADVNPPLGYAVTKAFQWLFGNNEFATRMPALTGFFVMALCLYRFVSRRSTALFGYVAALVPLCSGAYYLASEARPYGLMLGFAGLALICWQEAYSRQAGRGKFLLGFGLSIAGALLSHCFAILIMIPFGLAELVRQYRLKRLDWAMWAALIAPFGCCAIYLPLLANTSPYVMANYFFHVHLSTLVEAYGKWLIPLVWPLAVSALLVAAPKLGTPAEIDDAEPSIAWHEWTVAAGFAIIPLVGVVLSKIHDNQFFPRYGAMGILGIALLFSLFLRWRGSNERAMTLVVATFLACYLIAFGTWVHTVVADPETSETAGLSNKERHLPLEKIRPELPFVTAGGLQFFELDHYGKPEFVKRLYYLIDREASLEYTQSDIFPKGFPLMAKWFKMRGNLTPYDAFLRDHPKFLLYGPYWFPNDWLIKKLMDDGATLNLISDSQGTMGDNMLFEVTLKR